MKRPALVLLAASFIGLAGLSPLMAQVQSSRWGSVKALEFGSVNRATLDNHLVIPLFSRPTGVRAQASLELVYDSQHWALGINGAWTPAPASGGRSCSPSARFRSRRTSTISTAAGTRTAATAATTSGTT